MRKGREANKRHSEIEQWFRDYDDRSPWEVGSAYVRCPNGKAAKVLEWTPKRVRVRLEEREFWLERSAVEEIENANE